MKQIIITAVLMCLISWCTLYSQENNRSAAKKGKVSSSAGSNSSLEGTREGVKIAPSPSATAASDRIQQSSGRSETSSSGGGARTESAGTPASFHEDVPGEGSRIFATNDLSVDWVSNKGFTQNIIDGASRSIHSESAGLTFVRYVDAFPTQAYSLRIRVGNVGAMKISVKEYNEENQEIAVAADRSFDFSEGRDERIEFTTGRKVARLMLSIEFVNGGTVIFHGCSLEKSNR